MTYNVVDLFCGTTGFSSGFSRSGNFQLVGALDYDKNAVATARANHPGIPIVQGDILKLSPRAMADALQVDTVDVVVGGPPCQGFSSLRPFRSSDFDDPRNSLFEQFGAYVAYLRPKAFVLENVVGLLTHKGGSTLKALIECFADVGYCTDWRILNAASFGVPQKRERFVLIGTRNSRSITFPEPSHSFAGKVIGYKDRSKLLYKGPESGLPRPVTVCDAIDDLPKVTSGNSVEEYEGQPRTAYQIERRSGARALTLHSAPRHSDKILEIISHAGPSIASIPRHLISSGFSSSYSRLACDEPSTTMTVKFQSAASNRCIHPHQDRALTLREGARLQSFDDTFLFEGTATAVASQIGNAVPPLLGTALTPAVEALL